MLECPDEMERTLNDFSEFLVGPDKDRQARSVEAVVGDVRRIIRTVKATSFSVLLDNDMEILKDKYLNSYCVEHKIEPGSIAKYLISFIDLLNFFIIRKINICTSKEEIIRCKLLLENWKKVYLRKDKKLKPLKREKDLKMLVNADQIQLYESSEKCKIAKSLFHRLKEDLNNAISQNEFVAFRDHILYKIHFTSAHRSGLSANMTMEEFKNSEMADDGMIRILVHDHKTVDTYGSGKLMLYPSEYEWLSLFTNIVRPSIKKISTDYVFLSWNGTKMTSGDIGARIHLLWDKAGIYQDKVAPKKLCANVIRKSAATLMST